MVSTIFVGIRSSSISGMPHERPAAKRRPALDAPRAYSTGEHCRLFTLLSESGHCWRVGDRLASMAKAGATAQAAGTKAAVENDIGRRLRAHREARGLSLRELARRLGISASAISQ